LTKSNPFDRMANNYSADINLLLDPVLFQVVGSTPESVRDSIKATTLRNSPAQGARIAALCMFAAAVNKATMEGFLAKSELADIRPLVASGFSINNRPNMTGLTLLGHCLLTTTWSSAIVFAKEFRRKLGQSNIWDGSLDKGSLSEKQKAILMEKARVTNEASARLLGSGFLKYVGIVREAYTAGEAAFWGEQITTSGNLLDGGVIFTEAPRPAAAKGKKRATAQASPPRKRLVNVNMDDGSVAQVSETAWNYYLAINGGDTQAAVASIDRRGAEEFSAIYDDFASKDPEAKGTGGSSVIG